MGEPWRFWPAGALVAVRVTPRGGRDAIDGVEQLANGQAVLKVRVRVAAEGGAANASVIAVLAEALGVPKTACRLRSGVTSRVKQIAIDGDPYRLQTALSALRQTLQTKDNTRMAT
jgi:uncharacterized protein YggU (UPF0235/DUF167 family)